MAQTRALTRRGVVDLGPSAALASSSWSSDRTLRSAAGALVFRTQPATARARTTTQAAITTAIVNRFRFGSFAVGPSPLLRASPSPRRLTELVPAGTLRTVHIPGVLLRSAPSSGTQLPPMQGRCLLDQRLTGARGRGWSHGEGRDEPRPLAAGCPTCRAWRA